MYYPSTAVLNFHNSRKNDVFSFHSRDKNVLAKLSTCTLLSFYSKPITLTLTDRF
jgi:hypothetical protein